MNDATPQFDTTILRKAGLTESQAKGYLALIEHGQLSPVELAEKTDESRTNSYMICEKLEKLGLASKKEGKKALYIPTHPSALEVLAERRRKILVRNEQEVKGGLSPLIDMFYRASEMPGTRTLQGIEGIKMLYEEILAEKKTIYFVRTRADNIDLGYEYILKHRQKRVRAGISTYALTPFTPQAYASSQNDKQFLFIRRWYTLRQYSAPVEIQIFGSKVALIAYGSDQMATVIQSPPVAEAMRQLFGLLIEFLPSNEEVVTQETKRPFEQLYPDFVVSPKT